MLRKILAHKVPLLLLLILIMLILNISMFISNYRMHREISCIRDKNAYSYQKFYSLIREELLNFDLMIEQLENNFLTSKDKAKIEKICTLQIEDGMKRLGVAKGYDCLLRLYATKESTLLQQYKAIKSGSYGLHTLYTKNAAINLAKLIILGYEQEVKKHFNIENNEDLLKYYSGYTNDEVSFLNNLIALNIPELKAKCLYRLSLIHLLGRSSFNEPEVKLDYKLAIDEIQNVIKLTDIKQDNILDIVLVINEKFAPHAATVISSSLLNSDLDSFYRFHIVMNPNDPVTEESKKKLASMKYIRNYSVDFIPFPKNILDNDLIGKKMKFSNSWPSLVMYRLYFDQIFPNLDSVLYLDADMLVLRDLNSFKKLDMSNYIAASSMDMPLTYCSAKVDTNCNRTINNFYKNSGIIFFNLQNMHEKQTKNMILNALENSRCKFLLPDQDLLNVAFQDYIYPLSIRWNFFTSYENRSSYFSYFIMHYAGYKPWDSEKQKLWETNPEKLNEITKYYWRYREITPWKISSNKDLD